MRIGQSPGDETARVNDRNDRNDRCHPPDSSASLDVPSDDAISLRGIPSCGELNGSGESVGTVCFGGNAGVSLPKFGLRQPAAALSITACCDTTSRTLAARGMGKCLRGSLTETSCEGQATDVKLLTP